MRRLRTVSLGSGGLRVGVLALLLTLMPAVTGCTADGASAVVARWLEEVSSNSTDRGWGRLHPETRASRYGNDAARHIAKASAADWSKFDWNIETTVDEDNGWYFVIVDVADPDSAPSFLRDDRLVQLNKSPSGVEGFSVVVRFGDGGEGIFMAPK